MKMRLRKLNSVIHLVISSNDPTSLDIVIMVSSLISNQAMLNVAKIVSYLCNSKYKRRHEISLVTVYAPVCEALLLSF